MISERKFDAVVAAICDAGTDVRRWPRAMRLIAQAFHAPAIVMGCNSPHHEEVFTIAPEIDPVQNERYASYYHRINPIARYALSSPLGAVRTDTMMIPRPEFARTEFFNDFLLPQELGSMLGAVAHIEGTRQFNIVVQRARQFDDAEIALYRRLSPHLQRAVQLNVKLELLSLQCAVSTDILQRLDRAAFLVDASAHVLFTSLKAEDSRPAECGLRVVNGVLRARSASDNERLHALIAGCARPSSGGERGNLLLLERGQKRAPVAVSVLPFCREEVVGLARHPVAIVLMSDPDRASEPTMERIKLRYALTPAETAFAIEIAKGDGIQACADRLGISRSTARTHLSRIFRKTETNRQAELARLLSQSP
jgi:DNA-binding CsgD family transcriptional regulator